MSHQSLPLSFRIGVFLASIFLANHVSAAARGSVHYLEVNSMTSDVSHLPGEIMQFHLDLHSAGILAIEAVTSATSMSEPRLYALQSNLKTRTPILEESASRWTLAILDAGSISFQMVAQDPRIALGTYRLTTHFIPAFVHQSRRHLGTMSTRLWGDAELSLQAARLVPKRASGKTELEEVDPNPGAHKSEQVTTWVDILRLSPSKSVTWSELNEMDSKSKAFGLEPRLSLEAAWLHRDVSNSTGRAGEALRLRRVHAALYATSTLKTELEEVDPNPGALTAGPGTISQPIHNLQFELPVLVLEELTDNAVLQQFVDAVALTWLDSKNRSEASIRFCQENTEDHAASFSCATSLGLDEPIRGRFLHPQGGVDMDIYSFVLEAQRSVSILAAGSAMSASLHNHRGRRIMVSPENQGVDWITTLDPGRYFIALEGGSDAGRDYWLQVESR